MTYSYKIWLLKIIVKLQISVCIYTLVNHLHTTDMQKTNITFGQNIEAPSFKMVKVNQKDILCLIVYWQQSNINSKVNLNYTHLPHANTSVWRKPMDTSALWLMSLQTRSQPQRPETGSLLKIERMKSRGGLFGMCQFLLLRSVTSDVAHRYPWRLLWWRIEIHWDYF